MKLLLSTPARAGLSMGVIALVGGALLLRNSPELDCPPGYDSRDPVEVARALNPSVGERAAQLIRDRLGEQICASRKLPESMMEMQDASAAHDEGRLVPAQVQRDAVAQKQAMLELQPLVPGATGTWRDYGVGPQVSDPAFPLGAADGIPEVAGRADNFAYDASAKRLFVAIANGGIWMSNAVDGDVGTLGDEWINIGNGLPTLVTSAVAWTPAKGGRVLALTGEHTQGGNTMVGLGGYWSDNLGQRWVRSAGLPDGTNASRLAIDPSNPNIVYAATGRGLFRSTDAGESFVNVRLPVGGTPDCAGVESLGPCQLANFVTDVVVQQPGGSTDVVCSPEGCPVLAAVGFRSGNLPYADGVPQSPGNGLYRSSNGLANTFTRVGTAVGEITGPDGGLVPVGFAPQNRIGRTELGHAIGPDQDHNYVYAMVQDAVLLNGGVPVLDIPTDDGTPAVPVDCSSLPEGDPQFVCELASGGVSPTSFNGLYVSPDFGDTWIRMADDVELTYTGVPAGSSLAVAAALGIGPGAQAWYNMWVKPDPTTQVGGIPTRVAFGLEEIWKNRVNAPQTGLEQTPNDFKVIATYFAGETCLFLIGNVDLAGIVGLPIPNTVPVCPFRDGLATHITTAHPDQQDAIFIPDDVRGGVWLFAGNDGGVYKQHSSDELTNDFDNTRWGIGANRGFFTLMNYGIGVAKDGTVYYGLQDNASGKIEPSGRHVRLHVGDGIYAAVNPDDSNIGYYQTPGLSIVKTTDGGVTQVSADPGETVGTAHFLSPFVMDRTDADHLVAAGTLVAETRDGAATWETVFDLATGVDGGPVPQTRSRALAVHGDTIYAGWCAPCNVGALGQFRRGLATNANGTWRQATATGLPNRYIYGIEIDAEDPRTVYVALGGYSTARWLPAGQYLDTNSRIGEGHVYKSTDGGDTFHNVSGNLPNVVTTSLLKRGNQLIAGTDIGVFISSSLEGGRWAPLGDLPNVAISQLELHPGDSSVLYAGTFGRGVQVYRFGTASNDPNDIPAEGADIDPATGGALPAATLGLLLLAGLGARRRRYH